MRYCEPDYLKDFHCIASACRDSCCAGWEVVLDEEAIRRYRKVEGAFGERLKKAMETADGETFFALTGERRCPFLNENNLCDVYRELGEEALCDICTEHPRFYNWYGDYTEKGLGLCCEEAQRLLFAHEDPVRFVEHHEDNPEENAGDFLVDVMRGLRGWGIRILQNRELPFEDRILRLTHVMRGAQAILSINQPDDAAADQLELWLETVGEEGEKLPEELRSAKGSIIPDRTVVLDRIRFFEGLECLDLRWRTHLSQVRENLDEVLKKGLTLLAARKDRIYEWEHLGVYFLYRYFMEGLFDFDIMTRVYFLLDSLLVLAVTAAKEELFGGYTQEKRDDIIRMYSREIEYCPENIEALYEDYRADSVAGIEVGYGYS